MGASMMQVQPSTQAASKSNGFGSPKPQNADIATAVPSAFSGQPRFGQPNQYTKMMPTFQSWDQAQFAAPTSSSKGKGQANKPFVAPTQFPVVNQSNIKTTVTADKPKDDIKQQVAATNVYGGSEGYGSGY